MKRTITTIITIAIAFTIIIGVWCYIADEIGDYIEEEVPMWIG